MSTEVNRNELESKLQAMYRDVARNPHGEFHFEMGRALAERLGSGSGMDSFIASLITGPTGTVIGRTGSAPRRRHCDSGTSRATSHTSRATCRAAHRGRAGE